MRTSNKLVWIYLVDSLALLVVSKRVAVWRAIGAARSVFSSTS